jgi:hypothetical protein
MSVESDREGRKVTLYPVWVARNGLLDSRGWEGED